MMAETYLVDNVKEQVCFVSTDLKSDLVASRKGTHKLEYVLPDGVNERIGYARQPLGKGGRTEKNGKEQARPSCSPPITVSCSLLKDAHKPECDLPSPGGKQMWKQQSGGRYCV